MLTAFNILDKNLKNLTWITFSHLKLKLNIDEKIKSVIFYFKNLTVYVQDDSPVTDSGNPAFLFK